MQAQAEVRELMGMSVTDVNGAKVGTIKQVYLSDDTGVPEWVTVHTGWFGMRESFVPLTGSRKEDDMLRVPYAKETIKGAPNVNADEHLSHAQIVDLYRHYGVRPPGGRRTGEEQPREETGAEGAADEPTAGTGASGSGPGEAGAQGTRSASGGTGVAGMAIHPGRRERRDTPAQAPRGDHLVDDGAEASTTEITRWEEQMRVATERHEAGRVRVRKWVETEMVEHTIPVSHEELRIDREPIVGGEPSPGASLSEDEQEIILYEERPVVTTEAVPVERIRIRTDRVRDEQTVRGEVRKERVEVTRDEISRHDTRGETARGETAHGDGGEGKRAGRSAADGERGRSPA
ncbi:MAG TPA: PRC and DUF2382 domain-containing protein [Spirillospora sp.]